MLFRLALLALAAQASTDPHRAWLEAEAARLGIPGFSVAVVRDGEVALEFGCGWATLEPRRAATHETIFPLYSVSKLFAGVAVLQQVEAGPLELDAPVSQVLADLPPELAGVSLRQALGHTTGLGNWVDAAEWKELAPESRALLEARDVLEIVAGMPRASRPVSSSPIRSRAMC